MDCMYEYDCPQMRKKPLDLEWMSYGKELEKKGGHYRGVNCSATNHGQTMLYLALKRGTSDEDRKERKEVHVWGGVAIWVGAR